LRPPPPKMASADPAQPPGRTLADVKNAISCVDAGNALFFCASPAHQVERYYKDGALDGCDAQISELKLCLRLKLAGERDARAIVQQLVARAASPAPSIAAGVWEARQGGSGSGSGGGSGR
jgi:hypothetical protein